MSNNTIAYKEALNEIISIQDTYITSNTPDNAAIALMKKWREKVIDYAIKLRTQEVNTEKAINAVRNECQHRMEEEGKKYEAILNDLKQAFQYDSEIKTLNDTINDLKKKLTDEKNKATAYSTKLDESNKEASTIKHQSTVLKEKCDMLQLEYSKLEQKLKESSEGADKKYSQLKDKMTATIEKYEKEVQTLEDSKKAISNAESKYSDVLHQLNAANKEKDAMAAKYEKERAKITDHKECEQNIALLNSKINTLISINQENDKIIAKLTENTKTKSDADSNKKTHSSCVEYKAKGIEKVKENIKHLQNLPHNEEPDKKAKPERESSAKRVFKFEKTNESDIKPTPINDKDKCVIKQIGKSETLDNGCILNDEAIDAEIFKTMDTNPGTVKVTNRMLSKLNDLQKLDV